MDGAAATLAMLERLIEGQRRDIWKARRAVSERPPVFVPPEISEYRNPIWGSLWLRENHLARVITSISEVKTMRG